MNGTYPTCRRCGADLATGYRNHVVGAMEHDHQWTPDGEGVHVVLAATSACSWNCLAVLAAQLAGPDADAAVRMVAERERQVTAEGWTPEHDDSHEPGELARAADCYTTLHTGVTLPDDLAAPAWWPWGPEWWKPHGLQRDLVRAGALLAAEADADRRRGG